MIENLTQFNHIKSIIYFLVFFLSIGVYLNIKDINDLNSQKIEFELSFTDTNFEGLTLWGMEIQDESTIVHHQVEKSQTFLEVIQKYNLNLKNSLKNKLYNKSNITAKFLKNILIGDNLYFIHKKNSIDQIILIRDDQSYLVNEAGDVIKQSKEEIASKEKYKKIEVELTKGIIKNLEELSVPKKIIYKVAEILSYELDLKKELKKGDKLNFLYSIDTSGNMIVKKIVFESKLKKKQIYYYPHKICRYVNYEGKSLKNSFLEAPLSYSHISSKFSLARKHPILGQVRPHYGVDYAAPKGTPIWAVSDGIVSFIGVKGGYGNIIEINHSRGIKTVYAHLDRFHYLIKKGTKVSQAQIIGYVGMTGLATGPHLHYEYHLNGVPLDPLKEIDHHKFELAHDELLDFFKNRDEIDLIYSTMS